MQANKTLQTLLGSMLAVFGTAAFADATWNLPGCTTGQGVQFGNSYSCSSTAPSGPTPTATATAWANDGTSSTFRDAYLSPNGTSGFGIKNRTEGTGVGSPEHSMDNATRDINGVLVAGLTEMISFRFQATEKVALNSITLGWAQGDRDLSVLAYTGSTMPASVAGRSVTDLVSNGWTLVSQTQTASNTASSSLTPIAFNNNVNPLLNISSSWWLISAYNSGFDGVSGGAIDSNLDYVKVMTIAGYVKPNDRVPEPGSMALLGIGLLGLLRASRKNKQ